jgi:non-homologous end-joining factor 1
MTVELLRQQKELISIINKKEKEINDYKENGAVISRAHLITTPFEETSFNNQMITSKKFEEISMNPFEYVTDGSWDKLYSDVTSCSIWSSTKAACSPITSPVKSTQKRIIITSPSKDTEFKRRKELMKQLEDDKSKSKKKKKKLM